MTLEVLMTEQSAVEDTLISRIATPYPKVGGIPTSL